MATYTYRPTKQPRRPHVIDYREGGTRKQPGFATKDEAMQFLAQLTLRTGERRGLRPVVDPLVTIGDYGTKWLGDVGLIVKPRSHESYTKAVTLYIAPRLGGMRVRDLRRPHVKAFLLDCRKAGVLGRPLKDGSLYAIYAALRAMLNAAIDDELLVGNPAIRLGKVLGLHPDKKLRAAAIARRALDRSQLHTLLEWVRTTAAGWYPLDLTLARAGLRLGEVLALQLDDLHLDVAPGGRGRLDVERQWDERNAEIAPPKHGPRTVDVSPQLGVVLGAHAHALRKVVRLVDGAPPVAWLFPSLAGGILDPGNVRRHLRRAAGKAGLLRSVKPHDLRHTFGSQLVASGESLEYVRRQMGHASIQITVDTYGAQLPMETLRGVAALDAAAFDPDVVADGGGIGPEAPPTRSPKVSGSRAPGRPRRPGKVVADGGGIG
jgi:integrase